MADGEPTIDVDQDLEARIVQVPGLHQRALEIATEIASIAQTSAPFDSGDYAGGIGAQATTGGARVFASDPNSAHVEFGVPTQGQPAHWTLRAAAEAAGYTFRKGRG